MNDTTQIDEAIRRDGIKPIFADGALVGFRFKAKSKQNPKAGKAIEGKDMSVVGGLIEMTFLDVSKQQPLARFVFDRATAEEILQILTDSIKKFDEIMGKEGLSKILPKKANEEHGSQSSYR